ncbi:hypothetical protein JCM10449v2_000804 [Rhodotorula kratochvilovae]
MPTSRSAPVNALTDSDASSSDSEHSPRSLEACAASFYDDASALHHALDALSSVFLSLRALSARLSALHPNDLATPTLALDLRDALLDAAKRLRAVDEGAFELWEGEERHMLTKDTVHASRWVVENPFTILARLVDDLKALKIPQLVKPDSTPSTFVPPPSPPPLYHFAPSPSSSSRRTFDTSPLPDNPTPAGSSSHPLPAWKAAILADVARQKASGKESWTHRLFDELAVDGKEGVREIRVATERGHRERWIIFLLVALFPILLIANLVEDLFLSRRSPSPSASSSTTGSLSLRSLAPTMLAVQKRAVVTGVVGWTSEERELRERRRRSADFEGALV